MNKDLFDSMQQQMTPGPEVRAALRDKLARPARRRVSVRRYAAVAACAALVIGGLSMYRLYQDQEKWMLITKSFHRDAQVLHPHSYVLTDGLATGVATEDATMELYGEDSLETGTEDVYYPAVQNHNGDTPSATETSPASGGDAQNDRPSISQDEAIKLYDILCGHLRSRYGRQENFSPNWPAWYGGGYLNNDRPDHVARLTIVLVKDYDTPELRQEIYGFLGSDHVDFQSGKYALSYLLDLQKKLYEHPDIREVFASSGTDEERNRLNLTLTEVTGAALIALAELDPDDDAIYVQAGRRITLDQAIDDMGEDPNHPIMPGGAVISESDENLTAYEPWVDSVDGADYSTEQLPEQKQPAVGQSVPEEEERDPLTAVTYDVETGEVTLQPYPYGRAEKSGGASTSGGTRAYNPDNPGA